MLRQLLVLLSDGRFHSGDELGEALGVSRAAVWKQLKKLDDLDIPYSSVKGKGYRLQDAIELLDEDEILSSVEQRLDRLELLLDIGSTNSWLLERASDHMGKRYAVLAEKQTSGRGRRGRQWVSPFGKNIYLSLLVTLQGAVGQQFGLSLMTAIAVERALVKLGIQGISLKWPNDIYLDGKKLAGILLEAHQSQPNFCQVVIGVGLNMSLDDEDARSIEQPWSALNQYQPGLSRNRVVASVLNELLLLIDDFQRDGFGDWLTYWSERDIFQDQQVRVSSPAGDKEGVVKGVNRRGELLLLTDKGMETLVAGELSVRLAH